MAGSKAKRLSSLFRSALKIATSEVSSVAGDATLKHFVSSFDTSSSTVKFPKSSALSKKSTLPSLKLDAASHSSIHIQVEEDAAKQLSEEISRIMCGGASDSSADLQGTDDIHSLRNAPDIPWFSKLSQHGISLHKKNVSRARKKKWIYESSQGNHFNRLFTMCAQKLGMETTMELFVKLGH